MFRARSFLLDCASKKTKARGKSFAGGCVLANFSSCTDSVIASANSKTAYTKQHFGATFHQTRLVTLLSQRHQSTSVGVAPDIANVQPKDDHLLITTGNQTFRASYLWLRDHCRCSDCYEETCHENFVDIINLPADIKPKEWDCENGILRLTWSNGHVTTYPLQWLRHNAPGQRSSVQQPAPFLWDKKRLMGNMPEDVSLESLRSGAGLRKVMENLHVYGFSFVSGLETTMESTEEAVRLICPPMMHPFYGDVWSFQNDKAIADASYLSVGLQHHVDTIYFHNSAGGAAMHCLYHDGTGGENTLVDGFHAAEKLRALQPEHYETLLRTPSLCHFLDEENDFQSYHTVLHHNVLTNQLQQIRYNPHDRSTLSYLSYEDSEKFYTAYRALGRIIGSAESVFQFKPQPGRLWVFDNWRMLHGRTAFTGKRIIAGCFYNYDDLQNMKRTKRNLYL